MKNLLKPSKAIVFIEILFIFAVFLNQEIRLFDSAWIELPPAQEQKWDPKLFKILSFGHLPVAIDWLMIQSQFDPSIGKVPIGTHPPLYYSFDLIADLDPFFYEIYEVGANLLAVIRKDAEGARSLLLKGVDFIEKELPNYSEEHKYRFWSRSWNLYVLLGYVYLFELGDMPNSSEAFRKAAQIPGSPSYLLRLEKRLGALGGQYDVGLRLLRFLMESSKDPKIQEELQRKWQNLSIARYLFFLNDSYQKSKTHISLGKFLDRQGISKDPWGGTLSLNSENQIVTTTPYEKVFGLK